MALPENNIEVTSRQSISAGDPEENTIVQALIRGSDIARVYSGKLILAEITTAIANRYVEENYSKIAEHLNPVAIANLTIAECSKQVAGMILPAPKQETVHRGIGR